MGTHLPVRRGVDAKSLGEDIVSALGTEAKLVLSDALIAQSLRRSKQDERRSKGGNGQSRETEFNAAPGNVRRAPQHDGD